MSAVEEKPCVREQVGVAVNATSLVVEADHAGLADRVIALGAAVRLVRDGVKGRDGDPVAAELASVLWRIKFGGDRSNFAHAATLLAQRVLGREEARRHVWPWPKDPASGMAVRLRWSILGAQVIREWCEELCAECNGTGMQQVLPGGQRRKVRGIGRAAAPGAMFTACNQCGGDARASVRRHRRAEVLRVSMTTYEKRWARRFIAAHRELVFVAARLDQPLRRKLKRA